jgi:hypothetical protein
MTTVFSVLGCLLKEAQIGERACVDEFVHLEVGEGVLRVPERFCILKHLRPLYRLGIDKVPEHTLVWWVDDQKQEERCARFR